jgi:hypothetical protein
MEISWIEHKGKKILLTDYTGIKMDKDMVAHLEKVVPLVESQEKGSKILMLVDLTGCYATPGFMDAAKKFEKTVLVNYDVKRAITGVTGAKAILLKGFNLLTKQKLEPFDTRAMAMDYLAKQ